MEVSPKSKHGTLLNKDDVFKEGELLQKIFDIVKREKLILGIDEKEKVINFKHPEDLKQILQLEVREEGLTKVETEELLERVVQYSVKTQHPYFLKLFYHGVDEVGLSAAWIMEALNTEQLLYENSPVFALMERFVVDMMVRMFGWEDGDGTFCPGGSMSNVTTVVLARHYRDTTVTTKGLSGTSPYVIFTSDQSHYSFLKAGFLMGLGLDNVVEVETDSDGCMIPGVLRGEVKQAREGGAIPLMVNATCGTTILGGCDPLNEIADICHEEGMWLHADGCVGGAAIFSKTYKHFLNGIHRADSISWNAHKLLCVPLQCSLLLTRHKNLLQAANQPWCPRPEEDYHLYDPSYDPGDTGMQGGRKVDAMKLYLTLSFHGLEEIERRVDGAFWAARYLDQQVSSRPGFRQVVPRVHSTNTCFWFIPGALRGQQETQQWWQEVGKVAPRIYERMMEEGRLMVTYQPIPVKGLVNFFRMTTHAHPQPTAAHMDHLLDEIERLGRDL